MPPEDNGLDGSLEVPTVQPVVNAGVVSTENSLDGKTTSSSSQLTLPKQNYGSLLRFNRVAFSLTGGVLALLVVIGLSVLFLTGHNKTLNADNALNKANNYAVGNVKLNNLSSNNQALQLGNVSSLQINGQLQVSQGLVLEPTAKPTTASPGQIYYNQATNSPYYYNGTSFESLAPTKSVTALGGSSGNIAVGGGLQVTNGQLSLSSQIAQDISSANTGPNVTSLQGKTGDITLAAGPGIAINGTTISSSIGSLVNSFQGQSGDITLTAGPGISINGTTIGLSSTGNGVDSLNNIGGAVTINGSTNEITVNTSSIDGEITLSTPQGIAVTSSPEFSNLTLSSLNASGIIHTNSLGQLSTGPVVLGTDTSGDYVSSLGTTNGLTVLGNGGASSSPSISVDYGSTAGSSVEGNTTLTCPSGTGNLVGTGNAITLGTGGACNSLTITDSPVFSGNLSVEGPGGISVGSSTNQGAVSFTDGTGDGYLASIGLNGASLSSNQTYVLPSTGGTICLSTGNCSSVSGVASLNGLVGALTLEDTTGELTFNPTGQDIDINLPQGLNVSSSPIFADLTLNNLGSAGVVHTNSLGQLSTGPVVLGTDTSGDYVESIGTVTGLSVSGNNAVSASPDLSVNYGDSANTSVEGNNTITCASGSGNLIDGGNSITLGDGGTCNAITISNSPTFSGNLAVQGGGGVSIGTASTPGVLTLADGYGDFTTFQAGDSDGSDLNFTFPTTAGLSGQCLSTDGSGNLSFINCLDDSNGVSSLNGLSGSLTLKDSEGQLTFTNADQDININLPQELTSSSSPIFDGLTLSTTPLGISSGGTGQATAPTAGQLLIGNNSNGFSVANLTQGTGISITNGNGSISLDLSNTTVTSGTYGGPADVATFTVNSQGQLTNAGSTPIAINGNQITSGNVGVAYGGTGLSSYSVGDLLYASGATTLATLSDVSDGDCLVSGGVGVAPSWGSCAGTSGITGTGTTGDLALFSGTNTLASSALSQSSGDLTDSGTLTIQGTGGLTLANGSGTVNLLSPTTGTTTFTLPSSEGSSGQCLETDGSSNGVLSFGNCLSGATGGSGGVVSLDDLSGAVALKDSEGQLTFTNADQDININLPQELTSSSSPIFDGLTLSTTPLGISSGGTGQATAPTAGQLLIGNNSNGFSVANLTQGTGISITNGNGSISLDLSNTTVTSGTYGGPADVATFTVNSQGQLTNAGSTPIAINGNQITSGNVGVAYGGTGLSSYSVGDLLYASGATTLATLSDVSDGDCLVSGGVGVAPYWGSCAGTSGITGTGTTGDLALFSGTNTLASSALSQSSGDLTDSGTLTIQGTGGLTLANGSGTVNLLSPTTGTTTFTLPSSEGSSGQCLETDGSSNGVLSFGNCLSGATGGSGGVVSLDDLSGAVALKDSEGQLTFTNADQDININLPQELTSSSSPIFDGLTLSTTPLGISSGGTGQATAPTAGQLLIGNNSNGFSVANLTQGTGISITNGNGSISLDLSNTTVTSGTYGGPADVATFTVNSQGQLTNAGSTPIAINGNQITSGNVGVAYGGTGLSSYSVGDLLYASGATTLATLSDVSDGDCLVSGGVGVAPSWGSCAGTSGITGTGTTGDLALFSGTNTLASSALSQSSGDLTDSGTLTIQGTGGLTLANGSGTVNLLSPTTGTTTFTLPSSEGSSGQCLETDGSSNGVLSFGNCLSGATGGSGGVVSLDDLSGAVALKDSEGQLTFTNADQDININLPQELTSSSSPIFDGLTLSTTPLGISSGGTGQATAPTAGQLLIGNNSNGFSVANLTQGTGISITNGNGSISLDLSNTTVTSGTYGGPADVATFTVNSQGQLTNAGSTPIAINGNQITSGNVGVAYGGTGLSSYSVGDLLYASGATTLATLSDVSDGDCLVSGGVGVAPYWGSCAGTSGITGTGTTGDLALFSGTNTLASSALSQSSGDLTDSGTLTIQGTGGLTLANGSGTVNLLSPTTGTTTFTLPSSEGSSGQCLETDGSSNGVLSFGNCLSGATGGSGGVVSLDDLSGAVALKDSEGQLTFTNADQDININLPQELTSSSSPIFDGLTLSTTPLGISSGGTGQATAPTAGQLLIGNNSNGFSVANLTQGTGISITNGNGSISLDLSNTTVTSGTYGGPADVATFTVNSQGQLTNAGSTPIAINGNQITSGNVGVAYGGTGLSSYSVGDLLYASGATTLATLSDVSDGDCLVSGGVGVAPYWGSCAGTSGITGTGTTGDLALFSGTNTLASSALSQSSGDLTDSGTLTIQGTGGLTLANGSGTVNLLSPTTGTTTFTLPSSEGSSGQCLETDGSSNGVLSFGNCLSGATGGSGGVVSLDDLSGAVALKDSEGQLTFTNADQDININLPQELTSSSSPIFDGLTLSTTPLGISSGGTGQATAPTAGQLLIGNNSNGFSVANLTQGTGISITNGNGSISLDLSNTTVTSGTYGGPADVATFTVNSQGQLTNAGSTPIAINGNQITSGNVGVAYGGTGLSSYSVGDLLYASGATTLATLSDVSDGDCLVSGGVGVAPSWGSCAGTSGITGTGTTGDLALFSGTNTLASSALSQSSGDLTDSGTLTIQGTGGLTLANGSGTVNLLSPTTGTTTFTLPSSEGSSGQCLETDGSSNGVLSFGNCLSGATGGSGGVVSLDDLSGAVALKDSEGQLTFTNADQDININLPQELTSSSSPIFDGLTLSTTPLGISSGGTGQATAPTAGQLLIGNNSNGFSVANLTQGTGISITNGNGSISLDLSNTTVTSGTYGGPADVATFTVNSQGQLTNAGSTPIAINGNQITSGNVGVAYGGTGLSSYSVGDLLYASGATTLATLSDVSDGDCLVSGGVGVAPYWGSCAGTSGITGTGTTGDLALFSGTNTLASSALSQSSGDLTDSGTLTIQGTGGLTLANGSGTVNLLSPTTGTTTFTLPSSEGSSGQCLETDGSSNGVLSFGNCLSGSGGSGGVTSLNTFSGAVTILGTTNQVNVANNSGTITLSTPQDLATSSSPTFAGLTLATGSTFTNASSTLDTAIAIANLATGGNIGTAAATVNVATTFNIDQTTAGQTLTIPSPTTTTAGLIIYINNVGTASFTMSNSSDVIPAGASSSFEWNGTAWTVQDNEIAGTGLSATGNTLNLANTTVTANSYGSASTVATFTVNAQGQLTTAGSTTIAINGNQITSGTVGTTYGGTGLNTSGATGIATVSAGTWSIASTLTIAQGGTNGTASPTAGGIAYGTGSAYAFSAAGTSGQCLESGGTGVPTWATCPGSSGSNLFTLQGDSGPSQTVTVGSTVDIAGGTNISTAASATNKITINVSNSPTFSGLVTGNGGLTLATGSTFTNASSTLDTAIAIANLATGGNIGTAAATVNVATTFNIDQTTAGQTLTIPSPTTTTAGLIIYINNVGTASFTMSNSSDVIPAGASSSFEWNGTAWTVQDNEIAGTGLSATGNTLNLANTTVTANSYGSASTVATFAVNAQGQLTTAGSTTIAINGNQITSGTVGTTYGGTGLNTSGATGIATVSAGTWSIASTLTIAQGGTNGTASPTAGGIAYGTGSAYAFTAAGTSGQCLESGGTGVPTWATCPGSSGSNLFTLQGDSGPSQTVTVGSTVDIAGGTNISTAASATNKITINVSNSPTFSGLVTGNGGLTLATGSTFTNASSTLDTAIAIANLATGGNIGTAAATVNVATTFNIDQTTAGQTLTIPSPTTTTAGLIIYINNVGTASFTMSNSSDVIPAGASSSFEWNGTAWTVQDNEIAGTGLSATGNTLNLANTTVTANSYGSASTVATFAVNAQGQLTTAGSTTIAINGNQITSGTVGTTYGGTGLNTSGATGIATVSAGTWSIASTLTIAQGGTNGTASPTAGGIAYGTGSAYAFSAAGTSGQCLESGGTGVPTWATCPGSSGSNLFTLQGDSGPSQTVTVGSTVDIAGGTNISTAASATNKITINVSNSPTFSGLVTGNGGLTLATGSTFTNASSTLDTAIAIANLATGGNIGTAAATVNVATTFNIDQTTAGQTLTIPSPTTTTAGLIIYINNVGTASFTMSNSSDVIPAGASSSFEWNGTAWTVQDNEIAGTGLSATGNTLNLANTTVTANSYGSASTVATFAVNAQGQLTTAGSTTIAINGNQITSGTVGTTYGGTGLNTSGATGIATVSAGTWSIASTLTIAQGGTNGTASPTAGGIAYGTGSAYAFSAAGTSGQCLESGGTGVPTWATCPGSSGSNLFTLQGDSGPSQTVTVGSTVDIAGGTNISTAASATNKITINVSNSPTFSGLVTGNGGLTLATGSTFTNASSTLDTAIAIANLATGGNIGTAAATVNVATTFNIDQTTAGQTLTIPSPTTTTAGLIIYINNVGTASFTMSNSSDVIPAGASSSFEWNGTAWTVQDNEIAGTGLSATGNTLNLANTTVTANSYGSASTVATFAVNAQGQLTTAGSTTIAINGNQITSGTVGTTYGGTGLNTSGATGIATVSAGTWSIASTLTIAQGGTNGTASPTAGGIAYGTGSAYAFTAAGTSGQCLESGGTGVPTWGNCDIGAIIQVPTSTATNTITPATSGVVGLTVNGTNTGTAATALAVVQGYGATGQTITSSSTGDAEDINLTNTSGTQANGLAITRNGTGGTTTNLLNLTNTNGTVTNAITISGTYTNDLINSTNFSVTNAGAVTAGTYNTDTLNSTSLQFSGATPVISASTSNTGLTLQANGTGTLTLNTSGIGTVDVGTGSNAQTVAVGNTSAATTVSIQGGTTASAVSIKSGAAGDVNINASDTTAVTNIATGSTTGAISIGGGDDTLAVNTSNWDITSVGVASGLTGLSSSGSIKFSGLSTNGIVTTTGGTGTLSVVTSVPIAEGGTNGTASPTAGGIAYGTGSAYAFSAAGTSGQCLESGGTGVPTWATCPGSSGSNLFTLQGDSGPSQTVTVGSTVDIAGGTNISTAASATNKITINVSNSPTFSGLVTGNGGLTLATGSTFTNASATLNTAIAIANLATGGNIGTAAATVNVATTFNIDQTTAGQTLTIPSPTTTTAGLIIYINNVGTASFTMSNSSDVIPAGASSSFEWNGTAWTVQDNEIAGTGLSATGNTLNLANTTVTANSYGSASTVATFTVNAQGQLTTAGSTTIAINGNQITSGTVGTTYGGTGLNTSGATGIATVSAGTWSIASTLTIAQGGTNGTASPTAGGIAYGTGSAYAFSAAGTSGQCLESGGTGVPTWGNCDIGAIIQVPTSTATNTITPATSGVVGLTVNGTNTGTAATALAVVQGYGATGQTITSSSTGDAEDINLTNTSGTQANGLAITRNGTGGTTTNLLNLTNTNGTVTNAITISGTYTNDLINSTNFSVTNAGAVTAGTYNTDTLNSTSLQFSGATPVISASTSNTGLTLQANGTGTLTLNTSGIGTVDVGTGSNAQTVAVGNTSAATTVSIQGGTTASAVSIKSGAAGDVNINASDTTAVTNIATGSTTGAISIGGGDDTLAVNTSNWDITSVGVASGLTGLSSSGSIKFSGLSTNGIVTTTGGTGTLSVVTSVPIAEGGTNGTASPTAGGIAYGTGSAYAFTAVGTSGQCLTSAAAGEPTWAVCTPANGTSLFTLQGNTGSQNVTTGSTVSVIGSGNITTAASATNVVTVTTINNPTFTGLITGTGGTTISGAAINLNASSGNNTNINTGTSDGQVSIGNSLAGAITLQSGSTITLTPSGSSNTGLVVKPTDDSTAAFSVQNTSSVSVLSVDTTDGRVGINISGTPAYALDVNGQINSNTAVSVGGVDLCTVDDCIPAAGSDNYIQNGTTVQAGVGYGSNFAIRSASALAVTSVIQGASGQTADLLDLDSWNGTSATILDSFNSNGSLVVKNLSNTTTELQIQNSTVGEILQVNSTSQADIYSGTDIGSIGINGASVTSGYALNVQGSVNATQIYEEGVGICLVTNNCTAIGTAGGDLTGSYPDPTIAKLQNTTLTISSPSNGQLLAYNGSAWVNTNTVGALIAEDPTNSTTAFQIQDSSGASVLTADTTDHSIIVTGAANPAGLTQVGSNITTGSSPISVAVSGNYAYVANELSDDMQIFNISNPASVTQVGSNITTGTYPVSIAVSGNYAYVIGDGASTLQVFNISNPASVTQVGSNVTTATDPHSVAVSGNYAYVVSDSSGTSGTLQVFNISNPASVTQVGSNVTTGANPYSVAVSGNYAYVVNNESYTLQVFNVSNPASVTQVGSNVNTGIGPYSVAVSGNYAYVVNTSGTLQVFNISNPASVTQVGSNVTTGADPDSVAVSGNYAYVVNYSGGTLRVFNVSNPASVTQVGSNVTTGNGPYSVAVSGNYAYVVNYTSGTLQIFNINPAPTLQVNNSAGASVLSVDTTGAGNLLNINNGSATAPSNVMTLSNTGALSLENTANSTSAFNIQNANGMSVFNVDTQNQSVTISGNSGSANSPTQVGSNVTTGTEPYSVAVSGNYAYVVNYVGDTLQIFNISNPASVTQVGSNVTTGKGTSPISVAVSGNYAYVVNEGSDTLQIFNVSNPASVTQVGSNVTTGTDPISVAVSGNYAYVANELSDDMQIFNISNPASVTQVGSNITTGTYPVSIAVSGNYAYVVNEDSGTLQIFNVSNPASVTQVGSNVATGTDPYSVAVSGNYAYVVNEGSDTLQIFNVSNPASVTQVGSNVTTGTDPISVAVSGNYAYVVNAGSNTLQIFNISNPASVTQVGSNVTTGTDPHSVAVSGNYAYVVNSVGDTLQVFNINQPSAPPALQVQNAASGTDVLTVNSSTYNVCIDLSSCTNTLAVEGTVYASGGFTSSGSPDISEYIPVEGNVSAYDVVSAGPDGDVDAVQSSTPYDPTAIGVISDGTSSFIGNAPSDGGSTAGEMPLVLAGRVPVHVTNMNGPIEPGDYLTTSSIPGYAMLATEPGPTIGKALAAFDGSSGTVMALINVSYYAGPSTASYVQNGGNAILTGLTVSGSADFSDLNVSGIADINDLSVQTLAVAGNLSVGGNLTVTGLTSVADITISGHIITAGGEPTSSVQVAAGNGATATVSGDDTTGTITINTGSDPTSGALTDILFSQSYGAAPHVVLSPSNAAAANLHYYKGTTTSTDFMLNTTDTPAANTTYQYDYFIAQ